MSFEEEHGFMSKHKSSKYKGMNHYEVGEMNGHSKKKVDSMIKMAKKQGAKMSALKKMKSK